MTESQPFSDPQMRLSPVDLQGTWTVNFNENTEVDGAKSITKIKKNKEVLVDFVKRGNTFVATNVSVKQPVTIPPKWVIDVKGLISRIMQRDNPFSASAHPASSRTQSVTWCRP